MNNNFNTENDSFLLGILLNLSGLSKIDVLRIANKELILDEEKTPNDIRNFILEDSQYKQTLLRKLCNVGIRIEDLINNFNLNKLEIENNIDNYFFYFNMIDFKIRSSKDFRERMIKLLLSYNVKSREIAEIMDVAYTTVRSYIRG
ncbi:MAG: hypothetical protein RR904_05540 [Bacilli bacterium]